MSSTRRPKSQVWVEIPYSPLSKYHTPSTSALKHKTESRKHKLERLITKENIHRGSAPSIAKPEKVVKKQRIDASSLGPDAFSTRKPKKISCPPWRLIRQFTTLEEVEDRVHCREFVFRFSNLLGLAKVNLEALDHFESFSEKTCKAIILSLLKLIAADEVDKTTKQNIVKAASNIRSPRSTMDDIWNSIHDLSGSLSVLLTRPASPSLNDETTARVTRTGSHNPMQARQMIPVINSLIQEAVRTAYVRQEFDDGMKEVIQLNKKRVNDVKQETERWNAFRKELNKQKEKGGRTFDLTTWNTKLKNAKEKHNDNILNIHVQHTIALQGCQLRYLPLGVDTDGRVYYALSHPAFPGANKIPSVTERERLGNWGYFVFVWGSRPNEAPILEDDDGEDFKSRSRWWAFSDASTIRQLSKWLLSKIALMEADSALEGKQVVLPKETDVKSINALRKGLDEFADFLDVRCGVDGNMTNERQG